jgi:parvulin-like peptidyl-prolyl isomerase
VAAPPARTRGGLVLAVLFWAVGATHLFASDVPGPVPEGKAGPEDKVVVRVNGDPIMASDLRREVATRVPAMSGHGALSPERLAFHRKAALQQLVVQKLVVQEAVHEGFTVTDAEVDAEVARLRARFPDEATYKKAVERQGLDPARIREGVREHLLGSRVEQRVMGQVKDPSEADLRSYFKDHPDKFRIPPQAEVTYILAPVDASAPKEAWDAAKAALEPLKERVRKGEAFAQVAKEAEGQPDLRVVSMGRVHQGQGQIGEIDKAAFALEPGQVSDPVWTLYGYALVSVTSKRAARDMAFDELNLDLFKREWIEARRKEVLEKWLGGLMDKAKLEFTE